MNIHDATEQAYKNGYAQGKADAAKKIEDLEGDLEVWKQNRFNIFQTTECYERARRQAAVEILCDIKKRKCSAEIVSGATHNIATLYMFTDEELAELEKKYTEGVHEK